VDVIVFGTGQISKVAWYQLSQDSPHRVVAFMVDSAYRTEAIFNGLPVEPFEELTERYPPNQVALFIPLSYRELSRMRVQKYNEAKAKGYGFVTYIHSEARVDASVEVGENCYIDSSVVIQPFTRIGDNCVVRAGAIVSHDIDVGRHCFVSAGAVVGGGASIGERCVLALNSTVLNGIRVAPRCLLGAGAVLTADTDENGVYIGAPARRRELSAY